MKTTPARTFDEAHRKNLTAAARVRSQEQAVGNYIRRWNAELFATLLNEAIKPPTTQALGKLLAALNGEAIETPRGGSQETFRGSVSDSSKRDKFPRGNVVEDTPRKPPPRMDIL